MWPASSLFSSFLLVFPFSVPAGGIMWPASSLFSSFLFVFPLSVPAGGNTWPASSFILGFLLSAPAGVGIGGPAITVPFKQFQLVVHILPWVYEDAAMVDRPVSYVPGLSKIFDETPVTAASDNKQRDPRMDAPRGEIDGDGVPEMHPGLIFGHLLTSCDYDDIRKKKTEFVIETADGKRQKQVFSNNMADKTQPVKSKCKESENWTELTFKPGLAKSKSEMGKGGKKKLVSKIMVKTKAPASKAVIPAAKKDESADYLPLEGGPVRKAPRTGTVDNKASVLYIGRIPHGFYENEMEGFFKQFGAIKKLRVAHNKKDHSSSHIKGFLINFTHSFWPSLLKVPSFPIIKATGGGRSLPLHSMPEYESWKESIGDAKGRIIKYNKGLGTITALEYFKALKKHKKDSVWGDDQDGEAIELAFSKKKIEARKNWLRQFEPGTHLDHKELALADLQRSIPPMVDDLKVVQLAGSVSELSAYHHGEAILGCTITGMARDCFGSNSINLLQPNGQFGTTNQGGEDRARLSPITWFLFPKDDDGLLA